MVLASVLVSLSLAGCFQASDGNGRAPFGSNADALSREEGLLQTTGLSSGGPEAIKRLDRRVALVIGNSDYTGNISKLNNPTNDAIDIAEALERTGFEVQLLTNVGREAMQRAVLEFDQGLRDSDVGLFYYAGHAVQVDGRNFMIPTGAKLDISSSREDAIADYVALETVEIDNVLGRMGNAETELSIVILDACRNNPFNQGARGISRGLAQTSAPRGTFVAYATAPGKIAQDGKGENSPYTSAIVKNLDTPGLKLEDVFKKVRQDVALQTDGKQIPWENSSVFGDFYFTEPVIAAPPKETLAKDDYVEVQGLLARMGFYRGSITGVDDQKTRDAIVRWQTLHELELNGEIVKAQIPFMRTDALRVEAGADARARQETPARVKFPDEVADRKFPDDSPSKAKAQFPDDPIKAKPRDDNGKKTFSDGLIEKKFTEEPVDAKVLKAPVRVQKRKVPAEDEIPEDSSNKNKWSDFVIPPPPA